MLRVQLQVQVLPVATAIMLVCRYMVRYHGEWFDFACVIITASIEDKVFHFDKIDSDSDGN